jgi:Pentapeptide repeats (9 copies)
LKPIPAWRWMLAAAAAVVITAFLVTIWLWAIASHAKPGTDQASARLDAVRTGLAAGAGAGAAVGLMLAFRRQHHQEIATDLTDRDATERRITELYTKAVEQLGSDKAPVRLGGLYALERLAQDNRAHRQTIVNVICAYLRMPFSPTTPGSMPEPEAIEGEGERVIDTEARINEIGDTWQQERQVRLTAQRILTEHLRDDRAKGKRSTEPPSPRFWPDIRIDLGGATLIDFDLGNGVMADANFDRATFSGNARFDRATFSSDARFGDATFSHRAWFIGATFSRTWFEAATFSGDALFGEATFSGEAGFAGATLSGDAWFDGATFGDRAWFIGATFSGDARFDRATFSSDAWFQDATFSGDDSRLRFHDLQKFGFARGYAAAGPGWMPRWRNRVAMSVRRCS